MFLNNLQNNKCIAKNTLLQYSQMLILMFESLYTSCVVLDALDVESFDIYNVESCIVAATVGFSELVIESI